jgi:hypothetical protein
MSEIQILQEQSDAKLALIHYKQAREGRNAAIIRAHQAGVSVSEIGRLVGLNRGYVSDIVHGTR